MVIVNIDNKMNTDFLKSRDYILTNVKGNINFGDETFVKRNINFGDETFSIKGDFEQVFIYNLIIDFSKKGYYNSELRDILICGFRRGISCFDNIHHPDKLLLLNSVDFECYDVSSELSTKGLEFSYSFNIKFRYIKRHGFYKFSNEPDKVYNIMYGWYNKCFNNI